MCHPAWGEAGRIRDEPRCDTGPDGCANGSVAGIPSVLVLRLGTGQYRGSVLDGLELGSLMACART